MIHLVKVDLINLFISILCFAERNFHLIPAALSFSWDFAWIFLFLSLSFFLLLSFLSFLSFFFFTLKSGVRRSYHRILQGYILAFFTALYVGVWCSAFICSIEIFFNFPFFKNSFCFVNIYTQATC